MGALLSKRHKASSRPSSMCSTAKMRPISTASSNQTRARTLSRYYSCSTSTSSSPSSSTEYYLANEDVCEGEGWYETIDDEDSNDDLDVVIPEEEDEERHFYHEVGSVLHTPTTKNSPPALPSRNSGLFNGYANVSNDHYMRPSHCQECHNHTKDFVPVYENGVCDIPWATCDSSEPLFVIEKPRDNGRTCINCGLLPHQCFGDRWCVNMCFHIYENSFFHISSMVS